ncbi:MAG: hypothetical protein DLM67_22925 [Candidatus Nephthysia bennettiae]|nr:MAG: hypothetical protein DLM67_22925 [Candidatus Dormibacteraeota bacterium]
MTRGVIATPHHAATDAGVKVLRDGGNAVDAAVAADAVLCVVYPHMTSLGGDLFALVWPAGSDRPVGLAGAGRSGSHASVEAMRARGHVEMPEHGALSITVPGTVEAWGRLVERFGTLGMKPLMAAPWRRPRTASWSRPSWRASWSGSRSGCTARTRSGACFRR